MYATPQHHHHPSHHHRGHNNHHRGGAPGTVPLSPESHAAAVVFDQFCSAYTFKSVLHHYRSLCQILKLKPTNFRNFYPKLKSKLQSWKAQALWSKFDKRSSHKCYGHGKACSNLRVLVIGAGPCGLRTAIEAQLLGAKVVLVEKRDRFSRNNVLHLWPFVINDLKQLGAKKFYGKFCAGAIDHISIRQLQCLLLKVALLLGVEVFESTGFEDLVEPSEDGATEKHGWRARLSPPDHPANQYEFDVLVGADGKRNTLSGFKRKEFRGKLAIAITANLINKHSEAEARVQEISGVAFIFNQKFFKELYAATGIDLENIVYYKDDTHYFVMTAKKHSLLNKGVILKDLSDTQSLLHPNNVDRQALQEYAKEAADFSTNYLLPHTEFAINHYGKPDVAMFDFTSMFAAENACRVIERRGHKLLMGLVGDSLLEPFWPTGSGCARGFLGAYDAGWMMRSWSAGKMNTLEILAERESIYRLLAQTTPENLSKDHSSYTLDPMSRYPTINSRAVLPFQLRTLFDTDEPAHLEEASTQQKVNQDDIPKKRKRRDSMIHPDTLLTWCKKQVFLYDNVSVENFSTSFKDGRVLCAIIHRYRPELLDYHSLQSENITHNNELGFSIMEKEFGIPPVMTGAEMEECDVPDKLSMISYISQIYDVFRGQIPDFKYPKIDDGEMDLENQNFPQRRLVPHVNILKNLTNQTTDHKRKSLSGMREKRDDGASIIDKKAEIKKNKKRRSDRVTSPLDKAEKMKRDYQKAKAEKTEEFSDKIKDMEAKFTMNSARATDKKPKELIRSIGKIENTDWNMMALDKKMQEEKIEHHEREKVPKWGREIYEDKRDNMERRLRENGEDEQTIAKYRDIDSSLKRLEIKLREGSTLSPGLRGQNKVAGLANKLSTALETKVPEKAVLTKQPSRPVVPLPTSGSDLCYFCGNRVYLVERLSAEGKFFHRQCFKCDYCAANLRLGNYIYDREGHFGGKFFCVPHYGMSTRAAAARGKRKDDTDSTKENIVPPLKVPHTPKGQVISGDPGAAGGIAGSLPVKVLPAMAITPPGVAQALAAGDHRGTTPERVEFENSVIEHSDEDEYLSEDEWTDRNFGASANELDESDGDESEYSDLSDEEAEGDEELGYLEGEGKLTAAETRRLAESWKRRYSTDRLDDESDLDSDNYSEEYGAEGDESHTCTEGEADDDDEEEAEPLRLARELRRQEFNIKHVAPLRKAETSDSGSETEIASDEESEESDTQIDTDSEFDEDNKQSGYPKEIPTIVIDESQDLNASHSPAPPKNNNKLPQGDEKQAVGHPRPEYIEQTIDLGKTKKTEEEIFNEKRERGAEKSASLSNINDHYKTGKDDALARIEQIRKYMNRNESNISNEALAAKNRGIQLKRNFLVGENTNLPKKSVSTADMGTKFKSFMDKISETQSMLKPAAQPSAQMQAFMKTPLTKTPLSSPSSPQLPYRSISLPQGEESIKSNDVVNGEVSVTSSDTDKEGTKDFTPSFPLVVDNMNTEDQNKTVLTSSNTSSPVVTIRQSNKKSPNSKSATESEISKSEESLDEEDSDSSSENDSDYDNVPSVHKSVQPSPPVIQITEENSDIVIGSSSNEIENDIVNESEEIFKQIQSLATKDEEDMDEFGFTSKRSAGLGHDAIETINRELVSVNAPRSLELINNAVCGRVETVVDEEGISVIFAKDENKINLTSEGEYINANESEDKEAFNENLSDMDNVNESDANESDVDDLFDQLASDAFNTTGMIDRLNDKESVDNLIKDTSNRRRSKEPNSTEEKHERNELMKNKINSEPHEAVISLSSDKNIEICNDECIVSRGNFVNNIVDKDLLLEVENKDSKIIESLNNFDSNKPSLLEENKNVENLKNINALNESLNNHEKKYLKVDSVDDNSHVIKDSSIDTRVNIVEELNNDKTNNIESTNSSNHTSEEDLVIKASLEINKIGNRISFTEEVLSTSPASSDVSMHGSKTLTASSLLTNHLIQDALEVPESGKNLATSSLSSPESKAETMASESELLDWEPDHDRISAGEDLDMEFHSEINVNNLKMAKPRPIARIASIESLGDTNSEISAATPKSPKKTSTERSSNANPSSSTNSSAAAAVLTTDLDGIDFMDTSESGSSPEDAPHRRDGYRKLGEVTPTTPIAPSVDDFTKAAGDGALKSSDQSWSSSSTNPSDDDTKSSVQKASEKNNNLDKDVPPKKVVESNDNQLDDKVLRSNSEPPSLTEKLAKVNGTPRRDSLDDFATPKRYEGYIPRFKDRVSPFGFVRDSIDVVTNRSSTKTPLFTPSKQDLDERKQNENRLQQLTVKNNAMKKTVSPNTAKKKIVASLNKADKDGDLIREMVMNRIPRKTPEKTSRRGSRSSSIGSRSSLLSPQSSQENLLDKMEKSLELGKVKVVTESQSSTSKINNELINRSISEDNENNQIINNNTKSNIPLDKKELRLDSLKSNLSKSTDSFLVERNHKSLEVDRNPSSETLVSQNSCIIESVPFADDSQDEDVFEPAKDQNSKSGVSSNAPVKPARKVSNSLQSINGIDSTPPRTSLPATPLTHPEQFKANDSVQRKELFKVPSTPAPATPAQKTPLSKQLSTPSTVEREKLRGEARLRAQSRTDNDLGISPPNLAENLREKLRKGSFSENEDKPKPGNERERKEKVLDTPKRKDKEERVQELLAERRQHDNSSPRDSNKKPKGWAEKDERVRERLEEYRQKRGTETTNRNSNEVELRKNSAQLVRRHTHRPSLLDLESMQVFTAAGMAPQKSASATCIPSSMVNTYSTQPCISATPPKSLPGTMTSDSTSSLGTPQQIVTPGSQNKLEQDGSVEKKPVKKSKDRERRRSLIQVFTGMFSKSGAEERKKSTGEAPDGAEGQKCGSVATLGSSTSGTPSSPVPVPVVVNTSSSQQEASSLNKTSSASRSPATVKDKLSRLRLSRSKEKKKNASDKSRSTSADMLDGGSTSDDTRVGQSLPTSPNRRSFSPFSIFAKTNTPPQASGKSSYSSTSVNLISPRIEEESLSESEDVSCDVTPGGTLERGSHGPPGSGSSTRRSKAVQRAARQAELKRHRMAQEIQRKLEECEVKTRELEERGVNVEKSLRGENSGNNRDEAELMGDWFSMVHEKNALGRWEQELMVRAKELELEDRHVRLENELKHRMALSEHEKSREDIDREGNILAEILSILEQKDALVNMLEEEKQRYIEEDRELEDIKMRKGINLTPSRRETGV